MRSINVTFVLSFLPMAASMAGTPPSAVEVFERAAEVYGAMRDFRADIECAVSIFGVKRKMTGRLFVRGKQQARFELTMSLAGERHTMIDVVNGTVQWQYDPRRNVATRTEVPPGRAEKTASKYLPQFDLFDKVGARFQGRDRRAADRSAFEIRVQLRGRERDRKPVFESAILFIEDGRWLIQRMDFLDSSGTRVMSVKFAGIGVDTGLSDSTFSFKPPPRAKIVRSEPKTTSKSGGKN